MCKITTVCKFGDSRRLIHELDDESINCVVTSPPYWNLRDYEADGQFGSESTPLEYINNLSGLFLDIKDKLTDDGNVFVNISDTYSKKGADVPSKCKCMIPERFAWQMIQDGWILRDEIVWCLSGKTQVYVKTKKRETKMEIRDLYKHDCSNVKLWNGEKWTQMLGISKTTNRQDTLAIHLRNGEIINCTEKHQFPTTSGLKNAEDLKQGDILQSTILPEPAYTKDCVIDEDAAWFIGLYLAEGSMSGTTIQIAGHVKEQDRWSYLQYIVQKYGGTITRTIDGNRMDIRVYGAVLRGLLKEFINGNTAYRKHFAPSIWQYSNKFLNAVLDGYLHGDGHFDILNNRWRLGFTHNKHLANDIRTLCARLGYHLSLRLGTSTCNGKKFPCYLGDLRKHRSGHFNERSSYEIVGICGSKTTTVYDIGVEDDPHLFALASGVLTHNCKPNAMPSSVKDRLTPMYEKIYHFTKSKKYYYDLDSIRVPHKTNIKRDHKTYKGKYKGNDNAVKYSGSPMARTQRGNPEPKDYHPKGKNPGNVWSVTTKPFPQAHFACFPPDLIERPIIAGCPEGGTVLDPFGGSGTTAQVCEQLDRECLLFELNPDYSEIIEYRMNKVCV